MEELMGTVRGGQGLRQIGQMKEWVRGYDCNQDILNACEAAQWLDVRKQEAAAERRARLPGRCRGEGARKAQRDRDMAIGRQMYRANYTKSTFHDEEGNEVTKDEGAEAMLWLNRKAHGEHSPPPNSPGS